MTTLDNARRWAGEDSDSAQHAQAYALIAIAEQLDAIRGQMVTLNASLTRVLEVKVRTLPEGSA